MRKYVRLLAFFCVFALLFSFAPVSFASDNDARLDSYVNMGDNAIENGYAIPNLFRQDGVYSNIQRFPLVVKGGVEYVPLSAFILYPYVDVNYSNTSDNFFLVNTKNNRYISFNVEHGVASTYDGDLIKLPVLVFNQTRYVPARTVAVVLGFSCETYDDKENGIYAFRIFDGRSKKTLTELITPYVEGYMAQTKPPEPPPPPPVKQEDPLENIASRRVAICYTNLAYEGMDTVVRTLDGFGVRASFSVTKEDVVLRNSLVRRLFVSGHSLLVTAECEGDTPKECAESFVKGLEAANQELLRTLKRKTRMCTLPYGLDETVANNEEFASVVEKAGYVVLKPNVQTEDGPLFTGGAYSVSAKIKNKITDGFDRDTAATVTALVWCSDKTQYYTADVANFVNKYNQHSFCAMNEALLADS